MTLKDIFAKAVSLARPHPHIPDSIAEVFIEEFERGNFFALPYERNFCIIFGETYDFWELMDIKEWREKYGTH